MATDDSDVPDTGAVFTFGKSRFADNTANKFWIRNDDVVQVACGDDHTAFVTESGRIFAFGANEWGQLGLGHAKCTNKPGSIKALKQEGVVMVGCGRLHTIVYTRKDRLYSFGAGGEGQLGLATTQGYVSPQPIETLTDVKVKMISCGTEHSAVLTSDGNLYMFGSGSDGQLGLGENTETNVPMPLSVGVPIQHVSCGYYHTAIVTDEGRLYTFGENEFGKLGVNEDNLSFSNELRPVDLIEGRVRRVSCGNNHTAAVTESGIVYTWGDGSSGQLGHGPSILQLNVPQKILRLARKKSIDVVCGESHTAVITDNGSLYMFGDGRHGKLCQGDESFSNLFHPTKVRRFKGFHVQQVSCGGCQTIVRARRKDLSNGDASSSSDEETNLLRMSGHMRKGLLAATQHNDEGEDSVDLGGSFDGSARGRRRQRESSPLPPLARTLPPLGSTKPGALPSLNATIPGSSRKLDQSLIPNIKQEQNEIHEELITKNEVTTVEESPQLNLLKNGNIDLLESTHFSASKSVRELKPLMNTANGDLHMEDSHERPITEGTDEPDSRPLPVTKTQMESSIKARKLENHDSGADSEEEDCKESREEEKNEDDSDDDEDDEEEDEDDTDKMKTKRPDHFADFIQVSRPTPAPRRQTQARKLLEEDEEDKDDEDEDEDDEDSEDEDEPEEQPSRAVQIKGKTKEVKGESSDKGNNEETTLKSKAAKTTANSSAKQKGSGGDGDKKEEEDDDDEEEEDDDDDDDDDDEDEPTDQDDEASKKPAEDKDEDKDQAKKKKKETKEGKEDGKDEQENVKNGEHNEDAKQPNEPKAWQFWKKRPPSAKVNKSSASVSSEETPANQNRSKTCSIL